MPSLDTNRVSGLSCSSLVILDSGWLRKTCGSFWKMAATVTTGTLLATASNDIRVLAVMKKSALFGFGNPVGAERDLVQRGLGACRQDRRDQGEGQGQEA